MQNSEHVSTNPENMSKTVAIIGAGLIGCGWAIVFARAGWRVSLYDPHQQTRLAAQDSIAAQLNLLEAHHLCSDTSEIQSHIHCVAELQAAVQGADYIQECGPENLDEKCKIFRELDKIASPEAILASSSSGLMASQFAADLSGRHRALVAHPVNPPHLVPLVEISSAEWTDPNIIKTVHQIMISIGQTPITLHKEIPGFVLNRLQGALLNEALRLSQAGIASAEDIDKTIRDGLGMRWSFMGPFETIDLNAPGGLADYAARYGAMYRAMAEPPLANPDWSKAAIDKITRERRAALDIKDLNQRQYWRDALLAAQAAHKQKQDR